MTKRHLALLAAGLCLTLLAPVVATAAERATPEDAEEFARGAAAYLKKHGREKAFAAFNDTAGQFFKQDLYVFAYDLKGTCLLLPTKPERVGKTWLDLKDPDGKLIVKGMADLAKAKGQGWYEYKFHNPATGKTEPKVSFVIKIDDFFIGVGAYKNK